MQIKLSYSLNTYTYKQIHLDIHIDRVNELCYLGSMIISQRNTEKNIIWIRSKRLTLRRVGQHRPSLNTQNCDYLKSIVEKCYLMGQKHEKVIQKFSKHYKSL